MEGTAAAAAIAHRRVKRAMGLLRAAAKTLAPETGELDVVAELAVTDDASAGELVELVELARSRYPELDVVVLARPRSHAPAHASDRRNDR